MRIKYDPKPEAKTFAPGLRRGQVVDLPDAEAKRLIAQGLAEPVEPKKKKGGKQ